MTSTQRHPPLLAVLLLSVSVAQADELQAKQYADFDSYVLVLSWQTGFCQSQYERNRQEPDECRLQKESADKADFLTVYGLWPSLPKPIVARGADNRRWMYFSCAARPIPNLFETRASCKCVAPETRLPLESAAKLSAVMPGAGGRSCLERYGYAKHGAYFNFDSDAYFGTVVQLNNKAKSSEVDKFLMENYSKTVSRNTSDAVVTKNWGRENVRVVKLSCHGNPAYLTKIQLSLKADSINQTLSIQSFLPQPHPGSCGKQFIIDKMGY